MTILSFIGIQFITGQLLNDESIVGFILIKCTDHIIPVTIGIESGVIIGETTRVGIACDIQPVSGKIFTIMR